MLMIKWHRITDFLEAQLLNELVDHHSHQLVEHTATNKRNFFFLFFFFCWSEVIVPNGIWTLLLSIISARFQSYKLDFSLWADSVCHRLIFHPKSHFHRKSDKIFRFMFHNFHCGISIFPRWFIESSIRKFSDNDCFILEEKNIIMKIESYVRPYTVV